MGKGWPLLRKRRQVEMTTLTTRLYSTRPLDRNASPVILIHFSTRTADLKPGLQIVASSLGSLLAYEEESRHLAHPSTKRHKMPSGWLSTFQLRTTDNVLILHTSPLPPTLHHSSLHPTDLEAQSGDSVFGGVSQTTIPHQLILSS